jgi:hypothetical protein
MNKEVPLYMVQGEDFKIYPSLLDAPEDVVRGIAVDDGHFRQIVSEMDRRRSGTRLKNSSAFSPLNVFSNLQLDKFFDMVIDQYDLTGEVAKAGGPTNLKGRLGRIFKDIETRFPKAFSTHMKDTICLTLSGLGIGTGGSSAGGTKRPLRNTWLGRSGTLVSRDA